MDQRKDNFDVLVVDDDAVTRAQLRFLLLRNGYDVTVASSGEEGWDKLQQRHFPLVITDWSMPGMNGPDLCKLVREHLDDEYLYMILLTGMTEKQQVARGLEAGADDYITKPFDSGELLARLRVGRRILSLQRSMRETQLALHEMAHQDGLTKVMNRRAIDGHLQEAIGRLARATHPSTVALLDIDFFKRVNDTYGHQAGDAVLQEVASRIRDILRRTDKIGRYGGEEFVAILEGADAADAAEVAERIRMAVQELPVDHGGQEISVTISIGLCAAPPGYTDSVARVVERADSALYDAKRSGRNRVVIGQLVAPEPVAETVNVAAGAERISADLAG